MKGLDEEVWMKGLDKEFGMKGLDEGWMKVATRTRLNVSCPGRNF